MLNFMLLASIITIALLILLVRPLFKNKDKDRIARREQNILFARHRLNELDNQLENKTLSSENYHELKLEIENNLVLDLKQNANEHVVDQQMPQSSNKTMVLVLCLTLPMVASGLYWITGSPQALSQAQSHAIVPDNIAEMINTIESRLESNPDDLAGWRAIAPIYRGMNLPNKASLALSRIIELGGADASTYAQLADILSLNASGAVTPQANSYINKALELDANNQIALWLAGLSATQSGNTGQALAYWQRLLTLMDDFPEQQKELRAIIQETQASSQISQTQEAHNKNSVASKGSADDIQAAAISISVELDPSLTSLVDPQDTVFVVALAHNGPPAPLAVKRLKVKDLPLDLSLLDSDAMLPQLRLSLFDEVKVSARVSKSGQALPQPGDLTSDSIYYNQQNASKIELLINQQIGDSP